jgi:hypothetical protein
MRLFTVFAAALTASAAFAADPALLNLVMPEARVLGGMDMERARDSAIGRKLLEKMEINDTDFAKFLAATGFDPRRDIREVLFAAPDANGKNPPALLLVRGIFDTAKIASYVKAHGVVPAETINGIDYYTKPKGKDEGGFAIVDSNLAIAGNKEAVRRALQRRGGSGAPMPADVHSKVQSMSRDHDVWVISNVPVSEFTNNLPKAGPSHGSEDPSNMLKSEAFKSIEQAALGIRFAAEIIQLTAETLSATEKDATAIADVVRFLATMVQMNRDKHDAEGLAAALDSMKLTTDARTTRLTLTIPSADLEKMLEMGKKPARKI